MCSWDTEPEVMETKLFGWHGIISCQPNIFVSIKCSRMQSSVRTHHRKIVAFQIKFIWRIIFPVNNYFRAVQFWPREWMSFRARISGQNLNTFSRFWEMFEGHPNGRPSMLTLSCLAIGIGVINSYIKCIKYINNFKYMNQGK